MRFSSLHPLVKLATGVALLVLISGIVQAVAMLFQPDFNILANAKGARGLLLFFAFGVLMVMMSMDRQPVSSYGIFVGPRWKKLLLGGIAIGLAVRVSLYLVGAAFGAFAPGDVSPTAGSVFKAMTSAMTSMPLAAVQQIVFSGYLLAMLSSRGHRAAAVVGSALLFAVLGRLSDPAGFWSWENQSVMLGLFLTATFLGTLRLKSGNIIFPTGILAGWLIFGRLTAKLHLFEPVVSSPHLDWVAPFGDPRRGPLMWGVLLAATLGTALWLKLRGAAETPPAEATIDADFKRLFPLSHGSALVPLDVWLRVLAFARFRVGLIYLPRLLAVLVLSTCNTILTLPERLLAPLLVRWRKARDPIFILGVHRSGTTHLHNLLALDPQFSTARFHHMTNPCGYHTTGWLITPLLSLLMPWKRPMDNVRVHMFVPAEEEFLLAGVSHMSPYWGMTFPRQWPHYDRYLLPSELPEREKAEWKRRYAYVLDKLMLFSRKLPIFKNPYNTGRVAVLCELYPNAKFIHLARHPHDVYRSNMHIAREGHVLNQLQDPVESASYQARFLDNYRVMEDAYSREAAELPSNRVVELKFEDVESDPLGQVRRIYAALELEWTPKFESRLRAYLDGIADYQKNKHRTLSPDDGERVNAKMGELMQRWGYDDRVEPSDDQRSAA